MHRLPQSPREKKEEARAVLLCIVMICLVILSGESYALRVWLFSLFRVSLAQDFKLTVNGLIVH